MGLFDKTKANILVKEGDMLAGKENYDLAVNKYMEALDFYEAGKDYENVAKFCEKIGDCYSKYDSKSVEEHLKDRENAEKYYVRAAETYAQLKKFETAGEMFEKGAKCFEELERFEKVAETHIKAANLYMGAGDYYSASYSFTSAAEYFEKHEAYGAAGDAFRKAAQMNLKATDQSSAAASFKRAAVSYEQAGEWDQAIDSYANSSSIESEIRAYNDLALTYDRMAHCYDQLKDLNNALHYYGQSAELRYNNQEYSKAAESFSGIGRVYKEKGNYEDSIKNHLRAAEIDLKAKNWDDMGMNYSQVGDCYNKMGKHEEAAKNYVESAKAYDLAGMRHEFAQSYKNAVNSYFKISKELLGKKDFAGASVSLKSAAVCYTELKDDERAAKTYIEYAELMHAQKKIEESLAAFTDAGDAYTRAGMLFDAAESYVKGKNHLKAAELYLQFGIAAQANENDYVAGKSYMNAARAFANIKKHEPERRDGYNKAVWSFEKFIKPRKYKSELPEAELKEVADASLFCGECYQDIVDLRNALKYFQMSTEFYERLGDADHLQLAEAYRSKNEAIIAIDSGYYPKASSLLEKAKELFSKSIDKLQLTREYKAYLKDNIDESDRVLRKIELKPEVTLILDQHTYAFVNNDVILNAVLNNQGTYKLMNITFLSHIPEEIEKRTLPQDIESLEPGKEYRTAMELRPTKEGEYRIKPLEIFYEDPDGNKYVKASNEISLEVAEKPQTDFKNHKRAVEVFVNHAKNQHANKNYDLAGAGYRDAAETHSRFNKDGQGGKYYEKAIECYELYIKENQEKTGDNMLKIRKIGDAYRSIAECYREISNYDKSAEYFHKALDSYNKTEAEDSIKLTRAFMSKVMAVISIDHGEYKTATESLTESNEMFQEAITKGTWSLDYAKYLEKNVEENRDLLEKIRSKPDINLVVKGPASCMVGRRLELVALVSNPGDKAVKEVRFSPNAPDSFDIIQVPTALSGLKPGEDDTVIFALMPKKPGEFKFTPLEMTYKDMNNSTFRKGANEVVLKVIGKAGEPVAKAADDKLASGKSSSPKKAETRPADDSTGGAGGQPVVELTFPNPPTVRADDVVELKGLLTNEGGFITGVRFLANTLPEVEILESPKTIEKIEAGEQVEVLVKLKPKVAGEYKFEVVELFYKDQHNHRYFKSSNEVTLKAVGASVEISEYPRLESGVAYLVKEDAPAYGTEVFLNEAKNRPGLFVSRSNPEALMIKDRLGMARIFWLTDVEGEGNIHPGDIQGLSIRLADFLETENAIVLLEGLEYLKTTNDFTKVLHLVQHLRDRASTSKSNILIHFNPSMFNNQEVNYLERECRILSN